ncbi:MAG: hypothetical protein CME62_17055 [Halobacteriovoraceae bacterium]|nr:hypothetical protein [Halobacteriovoraceae bacterium]|tara:strand:+ start:14369 stop:15247 length:879 start_codon:yes stop_codon:yes gene_type:complete
MKKLAVMALVGMVFVGCEKSGGSGSSKDRVPLLDTSNSSFPCNESDACSKIKNLSMKQAVKLMNNSKMRTNPRPGDQIIVEEKDTDYAFDWDSSTGQSKEEECQVVKETEKTVYSIEKDHLKVLTKEKINKVTPESELCLTLLDKDNKYYISKENLPSKQKPADASDIQNMGDVNIRSLYLAKYLGEEVIVMEMAGKFEGSYSHSDCDVDNNCTNRTEAYKGVFATLNITSLERSGFSNTLYSYSKSKITGGKLNPSDTEEKIIDTTVDMSLLDMDISTLSVQDNTWDEDDQ